MKKILAVFAFLILLMICLGASAELGGVVLPEGALKKPDIPENYKGETVILPDEFLNNDKQSENNKPEEGNGRLSLYSSGQSGAAISITEEGPYFVKHTWWVQVTGANGPFLYTYDIVIPHTENGQTTYERVVHLDNSPANGLYYQFQWNGWYEFWVKVTDTYGNYIGFERRSFRVNDSGHTERLTVKLYTYQENYFTGETIWTAGVNGGTGGYTYHFYLSELETGFDGSCTSRTRDFSTASWFSYQFLAGGKYRLSVTVRDSAGYEAWDQIELDLSNYGRDNLTTLAKKLIKACRDAGNTTDYQIAKWAHDWLLSNVDYDHDFHHYGADAAFVLNNGGKTVCDGYAKAFYMLMKVAGIPCRRVVSDDNTHAWDELELGGKWYMVDCTWDDASAGFGKDTHRYCFITDKALRIDHGAYHRDYACTSVDCNYYVREQTAYYDWLFPLLRQVQEKLQNGYYIVAVNLPDIYTAEGIDYQPNTPVGITADQFCCEYASYYPERYYQGEPVQMIMTGYTSTRWIKAEVDFAGKTLKLPKGLKVVDSSAFAGDTSIMAMEFPNGTQTIGPMAFNGCSNLWKIVIPASVTNIMDNAFDTSTGHLCIVAPKNSAGYSYATNNHLLYEELK